VIVTSRAALRVSGERELAVLPLELAGATAAPASQSESVRLFVDRARAVKPDFALTEQTVPVVAEICRRLDGLPLAVELAAARIRLLDPESVLARLVRRLPFLTGGARDLPTRQQTLRNTIAWSYELLTAQEQTLFRTMAVFVGGCTLEALQTVSPDSTEVLDDADSLVAKSLARSVVTAPGEIRLTMLETTREFGLEQLAWSGELEGLRWRHAEYFLALAEEAEPALWGPTAGTWHANLETEHDNIRAALEWGLSVSVEAGSQVALRLAGSLARFWWSHAHFGEGLGWLRRALAASPCRSRERIKTLHGAAWLAHFMHDSATARAFLEESLSIARELGDDWSVAWVFHLLGRVAYFDGDHAGQAVSHSRAKRCRAPWRPLVDCLVGSPAWPGSAHCRRLRGGGRTLRAEHGDPSGTRPSRGDRRAVSAHGHVGAATGRFRQSSRPVSGVSRDWFGARRDLSHQQCAGAVRQPRRGA
jgi:predicted ATPase